MKTLFIEAKRKNIELDASLLKELENLNNIHILYSIQYKALAIKLKKELESEGKRVSAIQQVLGCSKIKPKGTLVLIGNGRFHALNLALSTNKEVYILEGSSLSKISKEEIEKERKKEKGKLIKFYSSSSLGLLVSLKPGQNQLNQALNFKAKAEKKFKDKKIYLFLAETLNLAELENFPIDFWVNFACQGIALDSSKIINYEKIRV